MRVEMTLLWILVLLQMGVLTLVVYRQRYTASRSQPSTARNRLGEPLKLDDLHSILPVTVTDGPHGYLFVAATCSVCEQVLSRLKALRRGPSSMPLTLVGIGASAPVTARFKETAMTLGAGLMSCTRPSQLGVHLTPTLVITDVDGIIRYSGQAPDAEYVRAMLSSSVPSAQNTLTHAVGPMISDRTSR